MRAMKYAAQTHNGRRRNAAPAGFTLLELLIVIALTAIIIVLVFRPLIDSFNLTSRAGTQIESQTAAREILREVSEKVSNAEFIYDNTRPNAKINVWLQDSGGNPIVSQLQFGLIDFVAPGHQADQTTNPTGPTDPTTGEPILDPNTSAGKRAVSLPSVPGRIVERIFLALRDNSSGTDGHNIGAPGDPTGQPQSGMPFRSGQYHGYANRWADPQQAGSPGNDNRYTLYRAQFLAYIPDPDDATKYMPNLKLFHTGANPFDPATKTDTRTDPIIQNDPNFFYDDGLAGETGSKGDLKWAVPGWQDLAPDHKVHYWENWRAVATSMLQLNKADTIGLDRDEKGRIVYDNNGRPTPRSLITFSPSYIENEAGNPVAMSATGSEVSYVAASAFTTQHGAWTTPFRVLVYQNNVTPLTNPITVNPGADPVAQNTTFYEYIIDPLTNATRIVYHDNGAVSGNVGPITGPNGTFTNVPQYAFAVNAQRGIIDFAFAQWAFTGKDPNGQPIRQEYRARDINSGMDGVAPVYNRRYLCLDDQGNNIPPDQMPLGSVSPLGALFLSPTQNDATTTPQRVHIVPGTEVVYGPDQRPGPHYGWSIQYTRVSVNAGSVGPNQYKILYDALPNATARAAAGDPNDPRVRCGYIEFDSTPDPSPTPNLPLNNDPRTLVNALAESPTAGIYRTNSLPMLKTDGGVDKAADPVLVQYNFQMNRPTDVVKIDYLTRELMTVAINSRLYDPSSASPQDTVLTSQIKVRNLQR